MHKGFKTQWLCSINRYPCNYPCDFFFHNQPTKMCCQPAILPSTVDYFCQIVWFQKYHACPMDAHWKWNFWRGVQTKTPSMEEVCIFSGTTDSHWLHLIDSVEGKRTWCIHRGALRGGSALGSNPLPFYIPFLTEKVPLWYTFHWKMVPRSHTYLRTLYPFFTPLKGSLLVVFM